MTESLDTIIGRLLAYVDLSTTYVFLIGDNGSPGPTVEDAISFAPLLTNSMAIYSCVEGGAPGVGNISTDPLLWGSQSGDLRPMAGSPCIDSGDPALGDPVTGPADMGAPPFDAGYQGVPGGFCPSGADGSECTPNLQAAAHPTLASGLQVAATNMGATSLSVIFLGFEPGAMPYVNGTLCLGGPLARGPLGVLSTPGLGVVTTTRTVCLGADWRPQASVRGIGSIAKLSIGIRLVALPPLGSLVPLRPSCSPEAAAAVPMGGADSQRVSSDRQYRSATDPVGLPRMALTS